MSDLKSLDREILEIKDAWQTDLVVSDFYKVEQEFGEFKNSITFFGSARFSQDNKYSKMAMSLAKKLGDEGYDIVTGGASGIMEAANKGAFESSKGQSVGFNVKLPFEQKSNSYITKEITFDFLFIRKIALIKEAKAFVIFPGGFGTIDELFEILVLIQTKILKPRPIFLVGENFWSKMYDFMSNSLVKEKTINIEDLNLFTISDDLNFIAKEITRIVIK